MKRLRVRGFIIQPLLVTDDGETLADVQADRIHVGPDVAKWAVEEWPEMLAQAQTALEPPPRDAT